MQAIRTAQLLTSAGVQDDVLAGVSGVDEATAGSATANRAAASIGGQAPTCVQHPARGTEDRQDATASAGSRNRNLVIVRAGDSSLHASYCERGSVVRNWDLHISYFGSKGGPLPRGGPGTTWSQDDDRIKWAGVATAISRGLFSLDDYDYVALLDDDLIITAADLNRAFDLAREYNLAACQLSLHPDSFFGLSFTLKHPLLKLHYVSRVELMAPILRVDILKRTLPYLPFHTNLWAMDHIIASFAGEQPRSSAVLDAVCALHTRRFFTSAMYDFFQVAGAGPHEVEHRFLKEHGFPYVQPRNEGGVLAGGRFVSALWWTKGLIRARLLRKLRSFKPALVRIASASNGHITVMRRMGCTSGLDIDYEVATGLKRRSWLAAVKAWPRWCSLRSKLPGAG